MTHLIGIAREKNDRDLASLANGLDALIQLAVDQQAASHEKVIDAALGGDLDDLVELGQPHLVRIDQDGEFFLAEGPGFYEFRVDLVSTGFHSVNIGKAVLSRQCAVGSLWPQKRLNLGRTERKSKCPTIEHLGRI